MPQQLSPKSVLDAALGALRSSSPDTIDAAIAFYKNALKTDANRDELRANIADHLTAAASHHHKAGEVVNILLDAVKPRNPQEMQQLVPALKTAITAAANIAQCDNDAGVQSRCVALNKMIQTLRQTSNPEYPEEIRLYNFIKRKKDMGYTGITLCSTKDGKTASLGGDIVLDMGLTETTAKLREWGGCPKDSLNEKGVLLCSFFPSDITQSPEQVASLKKIGQEAVSEALEQTNSWGRTALAAVSNPKVFSEAHREITLTIDKNGDVVGPVADTIRLLVQEGADINARAGSDSDKSIFENIVEKSGGDSRLVLLAAAFVDAARLSQDLLESKDSVKESEQAKLHDDQALREDVGNTLEKKQEQDHGIDLS